MEAVAVIGCDGAVNVTAHATPARALACARPALPGFRIAAPASCGRTPADARLPTG